MKGVGAKENNERSFDALMNLLRDVAREPAPFMGNGTVERALDTQKSIAAYEDAGRGIRASSLNTIRRLCARGYGGLTFEEFDLLRARARNALMKHKAAVLVARESLDARTAERLESRDAMRARIAALKMQHQAAAESAIHASGAFMEALRVCRDMSNYIADVERLQLWHKEEKELLARFAHRRRYDGNQDE